MSHFTTLVLIKKSDELNQKLNELLAPFDEEIQVPEYEKDCHCIGSVARKAAREEAARLHGTIDDLRKSIAEKYPVSNDNIDDVLKNMDDRNKLWEEHIAGYVKTEEEFFNNHPDKEKPDPTCGMYLGEFWENQVKEGKLEKEKIGQRYEDGDGCGGTGKYKTTYNPKSKWDWWCIGGRWSGALAAAINEDKTYMNSPDTPALMQELPDDGNICEVSQLIKEDGTSKFYPFSLVTPEGTWNEKGQMGWWAMVNNEKDINDWHKIVDDILKFYNDEHLAVLVDCHI